MIGFLTMLVLASFVVLIVLFTRVSALAEKIRELEWELRNLRKRLAQIPSVAEAAPAAPPAPVASPTSPPVPLTPSPLPGAPSTPYPIVPEQARPHLPEKAPSRTREEFEAFVGGKLLNRIGALALVIGVGFFLKYAFDNNWITETMRVVLGFVAGIAVLFTAVRTHRKGFQIFAQGLFGAGIAILYLTVYASFNFYHLVSQAVAFGMMGAVTVTAIGFAFKYDSLAISLLAWAGGFLTPFLLSTGHANEAGLFTYIGLLEAGLIAVAFKKPAWAILEPLTLAGTYLVFYAWYDQYYADDTLALTVFFLSAFWALFFFSDVIRTARGIAVQSQLRQLTGILNVSCYYGFMYDVVNRMHHDWMGLTTLLICLAYLLHVILMMRRPSEDATLVGQNVLTAIILLAAATWIQYSGFTTVIFWSIEAVGLVWCSVRWNMRYVYIAAAGLLGIALIKLADTSGAFSFDKPEQFTLLLNYRALTYLSLAAAAGMSAVLLNRHVYREIPALRAILHAAWCAVLFTFVTVETNDWFTQRALGMNLSESLHMNYREMMTLLCCWTLYSLPLVSIGLRTNSGAITISGFIALSVAFVIAVVRGFAYTPIEFFHPILNVRVFAMMMVIGGAFFHTVWLKQHEAQYSWAQTIYSAHVFVSILLFLSLLTGETRDIFELKMFAARRDLGYDIEPELSSIENLKQLSLSSLWLIYATVLMVVGIWRRVRGLRMLSIILFGFSILKIFVYDLSFLQTLYRIFSFIGLGIILLAASYMYQRYKSLIFGEAKVDESLNQGGG